MSSSFMYGYVRPGFNLQECCCKRVLTGTIAFSCRSTWHAACAELHKLVMTRGEVVPNYVSHVYFRLLRMSMLKM